MTDDGKIIHLPRRLQPVPKDDQILTVVTWNRACAHDGAYSVLAGEKNVICRRCGVRLEPMWVLMQLAAKESRFHAIHANYAAECEQLDKRRRTKCEHCGKMTSIVLRR